MMKHRTKQTQRKLILNLNPQVNIDETGKQYDSKQSGKFEGEVYVKF